jgi:hypothetical protein
MGGGTLAFREYRERAGEITSNDWQVVGANRCER